MGWRMSFEALLKNGSTSGNAGLMPQAASHPSAPGFRRLTVARIDPESTDVVSLTLADPTVALCQLAWQGNTWSCAWSLRRVRPHFIAATPFQAQPLRITCGSVSRSKRMAWLEAT